MTFKLTEKELEAIALANQLEEAFQQIVEMHHNKIDEILKPIYTRASEEGTNDDMYNLADMINNESIREILAG